MIWKTVINIKMLRKSFGAFLLLVIFYSTVTLFARFLGLSTSQPLPNAI